MDEEIIFIYCICADLLNSLGISFHAIARSFSKSETYFEKGVFWGKYGSGPFCPSCFQNFPSKQVYLRQNHPNEKEYWILPEAQKRLSDASSFQ